jgi:hypothetical protein
MKKLSSVLTVAPAALLVGGAAMAAPPGGYDNWTVNNGVISVTGGCESGYSCTNLDATGNGILQQKVTDLSDTNISYFRTIITDEGATATDLASVQALGFRNEGMVGAQNGTTDYAIRGVIKSAPTVLTNDQMATMAEVTNGALAGIAHVILDQEQGLGRAGSNMDFHFHENGQTYLELNDNVNGGTGTGNEGHLTVRRAGNLTTAGTLTLDAGGPNEQTLAYNAGGSVTAVWLTQAASGNGSFLNRTLGQQTYTATSNNGKTNSGSNVTGEISLNNGDASGNFNITSNGPSAEISGTQWGWSSLFGTRPEQYYTNSANTGLALPPGGMFGANDYVIP